MTNPHNDLVLNFTELTENLGLTERDRETMLRLERISPQNLKMLIPFAIAQNAAEESYDKALSSLHLDVFLSLHAQATLMKGMFEDVQKYVEKEDKRRGSRMTVANAEDAGMSSVFGIKINLVVTEKDYALGNENSRMTDKSYMDLAPMRDAYFDSYLQKRDVELTCQKQGVLFDYYEHLCRTVKSGNYEQYAEAFPEKFPSIDFGAVNEAGTPASDKKKAPMVKAPS